MRLQVVAWALLASACTADKSLTEPPRNDPYFPTSLTISPDEKFLFVVNANSDLQFDSGTVQVLDLDQLDLIVDAWLEQRDESGCREEALRPGVLYCETTDGDTVAPFVLSDASVAIGNFAIGSAMQPLADGRLRLFVTVRGDPSITFVDFDGAKLSCGGSGAFPRCDAAHRLDTIQNDEALGHIPTEPFYVATDPQNGYAFATHLTSGVITLVEAPIDGAEPIVADMFLGLWAPVDGLLGATGVAVRPPSTPDESPFIYVTSRKEARAAVLRVGEGAPDIDGGPRADLVFVQLFFLNAAVGGGTPGDARAIAFSPDGTRAVFVNRAPPLLYVFDTSLTATGVPRNVMLGAVELCNQPAVVSLADFGDGLVAYAPCFATGQVYAIDVERLALVSITDSGKGPSGVVAAPGRGRVYVANYADDTISVVDARPGFSSRHRVVLRVGKVRE